MAKPTDDQLAAAVKLAKGDGISSSDMKAMDDATAVVRRYLGDEFNNYPLGMLRKNITNLSRSGNEPGDSKRTDEQKQAAWFRSIGKKFPQSEQHSDEYRAIHASDEYKRLRDGRKLALDYRCQLCGRFFLGRELEGHILDYKKWNRPGMMMILCKEECHPIADALRRRGKQITAGESVPMLFNLDE